MNPIVATYLVKITLRESDDSLVDISKEPTLVEIEGIIEEALAANTEWAANATAERTDI